MYVRESGNRWKNCFSVNLIGPEKETQIYKWNHDHRRLAERERTTTKSSDLDHRLVCFCEGGAAADGTNEMTKRPKRGVTCSSAARLQPGRMRSG